jgi:hypothetical protein
MEEMFSRLPFRFTERRPAQYAGEVKPLGGRLTNCDIFLLHVLAGCDACIIVILLHGGDVGEVKVEDDTAPVHIEQCSR